MLCLHMLIYMLIYTNMMFQGFWVRTCLGCDVSCDKHDDVSLRSELETPKAENNCSSGFRSVGFQTAGQHIGELGLGLGFGSRV